MKRNSNRKTTMALNFSSSLEKCIKWAYMIKWNFKCKTKKFKATAGLIRLYSECKKKLKMKNAAHLMQPRCKSIEFMNIFQTVYKSKVQNKNWKIQKNKTANIQKLVEQQCGKAEKLWFWELLGSGLRQGQSPPTRVQENAAHLRHPRCKKNAAHLMQPRCKSTEFMNIFQPVVPQPKIYVHHCFCSSSVL